MRLLGGELLAGSADCAVRGGDALGPAEHGLGVGQHQEHDDGAEAAAMKTQNTIWVLADEMEQRRRRGTAR